MTRISYARFLVEVDVAQPLLDSIYISTPPPIPMFYYRCMMFVHELPHYWNKNDQGVIEGEFQDKNK
ncbi:hypothetical protein H5410_040858 [Solanum commersonii]|uniref:Uncharacterized protein n=1 Tax=Solanum commersonii TaxID=4109 RepID=A0A9J5XT55_SOLCO|nr:hypothetical protein H5410_040858 [Solanum commersonii]